jgi:osmotically-inducible protein OsmY
VKQYLCALVLAAALAGQSQAAPAAPTGTGAPKTNPAPAVAQRSRVLPDAQIERNIKARLARSKMSGKEHFTVSVQGGVATLEGKTNVIQHKGVATRIAKLGGAVAVENHIQISEEARAKAAARLARYRAGGAGGAGTDTAGPLRASVLPATK